MFNSTINSERKIWEKMANPFYEIARNIVLKAHLILRDDGEFKSVPESEKKEYCLTLFDNVKHVMQSEALVNDGGCIDSGMCSMAHILKEIPQEKGNLIPQIIPILENYAKFPCDNSHRFCTGRDLQALGILYLATTIAETDTKYSKEMLKFFDNKEVQGWAMADDELCPVACEYLQKFLEIDATLAPEIDRISKKYIHEGIESKEYKDKKLYLNKVKINYKNMLNNKEHITKIYDKIRKTDDDSKVDALVDLVADLKTKNKTSRSSIEATYKEINPELAALREEERNKVKDGMDPKQAQKERREAVKAYYNKKQSREDR